MSDSEHSCLVTLVFYLSSLWQPRQLVTREWCPTLDTSSLSFFKPPFPHNLIIIWSPSNMLFKYVSVRWIKAWQVTVLLESDRKPPKNFELNHGWVGGWVDGRPLDDLCQESSAKFKLFDSFLAPLCSYLNFLSPVSPHSGLKLLIGWEKLK